HREAVTAVGGDGQLDDRVVQPDQLDRVVTGVGRARRQHQDAVVVLTDAELPRGADHAFADLAVGLARRDLEVSGQHGAGQRDHHEVALPEVRRAADDVLDLLFVALTTADFNLAVPNRLLEPRELFDGGDAADDERAPHLVQVRYLFDLQPDPDERFGQRLRGCLLG